MIGMFLVNGERDIAFSLIDDDRYIESVDYMQESRLATFNLSDGSSEFLTSEIEGSIHDALMKNDILYIGNINAAQELTAEYEARIVHI